MSSTTISIQPQKRPPSDEPTESPSNSKDPAYSNFRPQFHFTAPRNWLNDPCSPVFFHDRFHLHYQYVHHAPVWDPPILWNSATSQNLFSWEDADTIAMQPEHDYERASIFTGSGFVLAPDMPSHQHPHVRPPPQSPSTRQHTIGSHIHRVPTIFYTGVTQLPINWKLPHYTPGQETQNMAYSLDGMRTWKKVDRNPVLAKPPQPWQVTGWRDPFVFRDAYLDQLMRLIPHPDWKYEEAVDSQNWYYMLLGSGIRGYGGMVLLYASRDLVQWHPMPLPLFHMDAHVQSKWVPSGMESFGFGYNWEVPNLLSMRPASTDGESPTYILSFGTEGNANHLRGDHMGVWWIGRLVVRSISDQSSHPLVPPLTGSDSPYYPYTITFEPVSVGVLDSGLLYAASVAFDGTPEEAPIQYQKFYGGRSALVLGWVNEDWNEEIPMWKQGFAGTIGVPRDMELTEDGTDIRIKPFSGFLETLRESARFMMKRKQVTLDDVHVRKWRVSLRGDRMAEKKDPLWWWDDEVALLGEGRSVYYIPVQGVNQTQRIEVSALLNTNLPIGIVLHHGCPTTSNDGDWNEFTLICHDPSTRRVTISRKHSSRISSANNSPLHILLDSTFTTSTFAPLQIFLDHSVLEVFWNQQRSVTTRVYPSALTQHSAKADFAGHTDGYCQEPMLGILVFPHEEATETGLSKSEIVAQQLEVYGDIRSIWENRTRPNQTLHSELHLLRK